MSLIESITYGKYINNKEILEKQIEVYKLFAPPKKPIDIWRISKDGQEVITNFTSY